MTPERGEWEKNLASIESLLTGLPHDVDLAVLPELSTSGYLYIERETLMPCAEVAGEGPLATLLQVYAKANSTAVIAGFPEVCGESGRIYNSAIAALPDGTFHIYRKSHLFYRESEVFEPGDSGFFTFPFRSLRIGMMICYDWRFPEAARSLALEGADIIAHPSNLVSKRQIWQPVLVTRAVENGVAIVTANREGIESVAGERLEFTGGSLIIDHSGEVLSRAEGSGAIITAEVSGHRSREVNRYNDIMMDRRPELYGRLTQK